MRRFAAGAVALACLAGCGGDGSAAAPLKVSAAASLKQALPNYDPSASYSFAGSDQLAAQIRAGARPDVFAAANTKLPDALFAEGLVEKPVVFAANRLVIAVPVDSVGVRRVEDLAHPGVKIAAGAASVPVGAYTREVLGHLPPPEANRILANIRSNEPDVAGIVGKLDQGAVDAGFVYFSDVRAAGGQLVAIELPAALQPKVAYAAAVVKGSKRRAAAARYVRGLTAVHAQLVLRRSGFDPPP